MNEIAEDNKRKPKLTVEEQIEHLKSKGVTFELCDEGEIEKAQADYLTEACQKIVEYCDKED
ncbi:MAG: hypothetical protein BHV62_00080 [Eggerthella sp. 51_9]|nr:MAG: hypothetical protein BHV62_00080 [Eggerthella sp. 51_9]